MTWRGILSSTQARVRHRAQNGRVLLTLTSTADHATDLGFLLGRSMLGRDRTEG